MPQPGLARDVLRPRRVIAALDEQLARGALQLGETFGLTPYRADVRLAFGKKSWDP
ncbi:MAG: hypothetical protein WDM81_04500 [Rhizomicrobium sp.]